MFIYLFIILASLFNLYSAVIDHEEIDYTEIGRINIPRIPRSPRGRFDPEIQLIRIKPCQRKDIDRIPISPRKNASINIATLQKKNVFKLSEHPWHYIVLEEDFNKLHKIITDSTGQLDYQKINHAAKTTSKEGCTVLFLLLSLVNYRIDLYHKELNAILDIYISRDEEDIDGFKEYKHALEVYEYYINIFINYSNLTEQSLIDNSKFRKELKRILALIPEEFDEEELEED